MTQRRDWLYSGLFLRPATTQIAHKRQRSETHNDLSTNRRIQERYGISSRLTPPLNVSKSGQKGVDSYVTPFPSAYHHSFQSRENRVARRVQARNDGVTECIQLGDHLHSLSYR